MCETCGCQSNVSPTSSDVSVAEATSVVAPVASSSQPFVERFSDGLQHTIQVVIGAQRKPPRLLKSLLHGTFLGHPLHPAITDVPIGAWLIAAIFDIIWLVSPASSDWAARGALVAVLVGLVGALGAAVTGLADWSDTYGAERTTGLYHALLNVTATVLYLISVILRFQVASNENIVAAILGFIGLAAVFAAAYFGGDMVFVKGTSVNHTAWEAVDESYEAVMPLDSVEENRLYRVVTASGIPVVLMRRGLQFYVISATCSHAGGPLNEGTLDGDVVQCPWHGSRFCMRDGRVLTGPATVSQPRYDVRVRNGQVEIRRADR
jgi:nitrite reductase/ring-hydroxylating ferredoxin subunit/uncharacterized membrane protein